MAEIQLRQAVILAGGRGLRLRPFTDTAPKPMYPFHGRPFLEHLIQRLRDQGLRRILLLIGYRGDQIQDYFKDGSRFGVTLSYSAAPESAETGTRLNLAVPQLDPVFLMLYADNYWPLELQPLWQAYQASQPPVMLTVYTNPFGEKRNNVQVDPEGLIVNYDRSRTASSLNGVEIGFAIVRREVVEGLPAGNPHFESVVYPDLVRQGALRAFRTHHRYYSVGSLEELPLTERFLSFPRAVILDRDGVLNRKPPAGGYVLNWNDFEWIPDSVEALRLLKSAGYKILLATNQAGIGRGFMTEKDLGTIHAKMQGHLRQHGAELDGIYHCPHAWDANCFCRKPNPGLLLAAQREHALDLSQTVFVGDDERDIQAGRLAGCPTSLVSEEFPLIAWVRQQIVSHEN